MMASGKRDGKPQDDLSGTPPVERIAKAMARAGLCSRRDAEGWIAEGRVSVNGRILTSPAQNIGPSDTVLIDGKPLPERQPPRLWRFNKPAGLVTTQRDPGGRPTVFERLPRNLPRVISVGRLDLNSEGLLLLTNDGDLARHLELPETAWVRRYRARVHGRVDEARLARLVDGLTVDGVRYGPITATLERQQNANAWINIALQEGRNREVRRIMEALGYDVTRLIRVSYGPFHLGNLADGEVEEVRRAVLTDQIGAFMRPLESRNSSWGSADPRHPVNPVPQGPSGGKRSPGRSRSKPGQPRRGAVPESSVPPPPATPDTEQPRGRNAHRRR